MGCFAPVQAICQQRHKKNCFAGAEGKLQTTGVLSYRNGEFNTLSAVGKIVEVSQTVCTAGDTSPAIHLNCSFNKIGLGMTRHG